MQPITIAQPISVAFNIPQIADTTNSLQAPIERTTDYMEHAPTLIIILFIIYIILMLLVVCRRVWGLWGRSEAVEISVFEYADESVAPKRNPKKKQTETSEVSVIEAENKGESHKSKGTPNHDERVLFHWSLNNFNARIIMSPKNSQNHGKWKVAIFPANSTSILFMDDFVNRENNEKIKLVYLAQHDNEAKVWKPFKDQVQYLVDKAEFSSEKQGSANSIKIQCSLPQEKVRLFSLIASFKPNEKANKFLKKFLYDSLDFFENRASRFERIGYWTLLLGLMIHLFWLITDIYHYENGGGNFFNYPKDHYVPLLLWPLLFKPRQSAAKRLAEFILKTSPFPLNRIFAGTQ